MPLAIAARRARQLPRHGCRCRVAGGEPRERLTEVPRQRLTRLARTAAQVVEGEAPAVDEVPGTPPAIVAETVRRVAPIANNWMTKVPQVRPDLVLPPRPGPHAQ